ncbi:MAG: NAD-dependent epimerase/dehydratase family protein [Vicinamibacterales bacterium]
MRDASVLVIGGLGFIGTNLTAKLAARGARVTVLTPSRERHDEQAKAFERQGVRVVEGDVRDQGLMLQLVADQRTIFNLSGQSGAIRSMEDPWSDLDVNCRGNLVVLESMREKSQGAKLIFAGSRLQYGRPLSVPVDEDAPTNALCLHAVHKQTVEQYLQLYGRLYGIRFAIARITNPYGPGQPHGRTSYGVINRLIQLAIEGEPLTIYGDGTQRRDYVHVEDVVVALMALADSPRADGGVFNVGSGVGSRLVDVASRIVEIAGSGRVQHVRWPALAEQIETGDFVANISRIRRELGWEPSISLQDGLTHTVAFYRAHAQS